MKSFAMHKHPLFVFAAFAWVFAATTIAGPATAETKLTEIDFPRMSSGREQLELAHEYPFMADEGFHSFIESPQRRAAFEKTIEYFPDDKTTVLLATIEIARLDKYIRRSERAIERLPPLIAAVGNDVSPEVLAEAEIMHADLLESLGRKAEAGELLTRVALDACFSDDTRVSASLSAIQYFSLEKRLHLFDEMVKLNTKYQTDIYCSIVYWCFRNNDDNAVRTRIETLLNTQPDKAHAILAKVVEDSGRWNNGDWQARFSAMIEELIPSPSTELANALAWRKVSFVVRDKLQMLLAENPDAELRKLARPDPSMKTLYAYKLAIEKAKQRRDAALCVRLHLQNLAVFPIQRDYRDFSWRLRSALHDLDWKDRQGDTRAEDSLFLQILDLCELFPRGNYIYIEGQAWRADYLARRGKHAEAVKLYEKLFASTEIPQDEMRSVYACFGKFHENNGDYPAALLAYKQIESEAKDDYQAADALLRAVFINLQKGHYNEALRIVKILEICDGGDLFHAQGRFTIPEFVELACSGEAEKFWKTGAQWWPQWLAFERKFSPAKQPPPYAPDDIVMSVSQSYLFMRTINSLAPDAPEFWNCLRKLASCARWLPSACANFLKAGDKVMEDIPAARAEMQSLMDKVRAGTPPENSAQKPSKRK
ncbi:tetratricopeptide (TPR) repeat protein [Ereboglobus sp. PH5-5]|uniref:tetratricopeptide repeat protein n=1 Tax=Ereboglobus sp. PH5-5 TaxID=2940529 RepID=UPI002406B713|nr:hypothetical protein [Ereboglobus sp. PH5-5]MDF9834064.1 tetratricopeptide (TPR) repeat protein [Ereboglobus sp. PH5-5]